MNIPSPLKSLIETLTFSNQLKSLTRADSAKSGIEAVKAIIRDVRKPAEIETFEEVVARNGLTNRDIAAREAQLKKISIIYFSGVLLSILLMAYFQTVSTTLVGVGAALIAAASWWKWSFRLWQVRARRLGSVAEFMSGDWYVEALK